MNPFYIIYGIILLVWVWREASGFFIATKKNIDEVLELQHDFPKLKAAVEKKNEIHKERLYDKVRNFEILLQHEKQKYEQKGFRKNKDGSYSQRSNIGKDIHSTIASLASAQQSYRSFQPETVNEPAKDLAKFFSKRISSRLIAPITILGLFIPATSDALAAPLFITIISYLPLRLTYRFVYCRNFRKLRFPNKVKLFFLATPHYLLSTLIICFIIDTAFLHPITEQEERAKTINVVTNNTSTTANTLKESAQ